MFSFQHLLVLLVIIVLLFGSNKLRTLGSDLGASIKGFKKAIGDDEKTDGKTEKEVKSLPDNDGKDDSSKSAP